ncbi:MAG: LamG domain-containing protein [Nanoarchaeota archaeon]|nr:LamG domain-containing protein [Nanoarchaeota archaeon]
MGGVYGTENLRIYGIDIQTYGSDANAIYVTDGKNNFTLKDGKLNASEASTADLGFASGASGSEWNLTNVTYSNITWAGAAAGSKLNIFHYLDGQVNDSVGTMITGAAVLGYDKNNNKQFFTDTISGGIIPRQEVLDYQENSSTAILFNNYTINVSSPERTNISGQYNISGNINITLTFDNTAPKISSILLNTTSRSNTTTDNLTANPAGISDIDSDSVTLNYNWYRNGASDTILNMPFTAPDSLNRTYDLSGNDNHGEQKNRAEWNSTAGHDGSGAYDFDGIDDHILVQNSPSINFTTQPFSIEAWIYKRGPGPVVAGDKVYAIVVKGNSSLTAETTAYGLAQYDENFPWGLANVTGFTVSDGSNLLAAAGSTQILPDSWHHVVGVWNTTDAILYVDGVQEGSASAAVTVNPVDYNLTIGAMQGNDTAAYGTSAFNGTIDEVKIYNRSLSADEIALLYSNRTNITHSDATRGGENWTVKATPIDEYGLNGSSVFSNSINVTEVLYNLVNMTITGTGTIVNETEPVNPNQNLTIRFNISNIGGSIDTVWIKIWETTKAAGTVLWEGLMSLIDGLWQIDVPINASYPTDVNYTIYVNDSVNTTYEFEGNFTVNQPPTIASALLNATSASNFTRDNLTAHPGAITDPEGNNVQLNYNWYIDGISDNILNMPMTAPDWYNRTYDLSGNNNHGNITGARWNKTGGHDGFGAYEFDTIDDSILAPQSIYGTDFSYGAWVKLTEVGGCLDQGAGQVCPILTQGDQAGNAHTLITNQLGWVFCYDGINLAGLNVATLNEWNHYMCVHNSTDFALFTNGELTGSWVSSGVAATPEGFTIGAWKGLYYLNGTVDEVKVYNRTLSANEVALLYSNRTNITHSDATQGGDNWTVKVTPIDEYGLNGTEVWSNSINVTQMVYNLHNMTPSYMPYFTVNTTEPVNINESIFQNLTIRVNATNVGGEISSVWIIVWDTVKSAGDIMWQGVMTLVNGLWQAELEVNDSYPTITNFTVYMNDTFNVTYEFDSNFSTNRQPSLSSALINATTYLNRTLDNLTAYVTGVSDPEGDSVQLNYNWYRNGISDTLLNMPFNSIDLNNRTYDISGFESHGTVSNGSWTPDGSSGEYGAMRLSQTGGGIVVDNENLYDFKSDFTLSAWIKPENVTSTFGVFSKGSQNYQTAYDLRYAWTGISGRFQFVTFREGTTSSDHCYTTTGSEINAGNWYHIAAVYNSSGCYIYLNGTIYGTDTSLTGEIRQDSNEPLMIGRRAFSGQAINGTIDEVRIYNRSLSGEEINLLYQGNTNMTYYQTTEHGENWTVKVTPIDEHGLNGTSVSDRWVVIQNTLPGNVSLITPTKGNNTLFDRMPLFNWTAADDDDNDTLTYTLNITQSVCPNIEITGITDTNYTLSQELCVDRVYNWSVIAHDGFDYGNASEIWNFTIPSSLIITLTSNLTDFGSANINDEYNTSYAGAPADPFGVRNDGNIQADIVKIGANDTLWISQGLGTSYFQFKANNRTTESGSFDWLTSITAWTDMPYVLTQNESVITSLNYTDTNDTAEIDIRIKVPADEPPGPKSSMIIITGEMST